MVIVFRKMAVETADYLMIGWIAVLVVAIVVEIITLGLSSIWFAGGALVALFVAALHGPWWLQVILFFVVSIIPIFNVYKLYLLD